MKRFTCILFSLVTISLFVLIVASSGNASEDCKKCHEDVFNKALSNRFQHSVAREKCAVCHSTDSPASSIPVEKEIISKVTSRTFNRNEVFQLMNMEDNNEYEVEIVAIGRSGRRSKPELLSINPLDVEEITVPPLTGINEVVVEEVRQGIFIGASLFWITGTPATTEVEYGLTKDLGNHLSGNYNYTKEHRIKITGLKKGKIYYFKVTSKDILGNIAKSKIGTLNTSKFFSIANNIINSAAIPNVDYTEVFKVANMGTFISVHLNQYSKIQLTISKEPETVKAEENVSHSFPSDRYSTITVCITCHNQGASHPVGVRASGRGIITPVDLPTIENGIVTCVTCHEPHGGDKELFARTDFVRNICIKCHLEDEFL